MTSRMTRLVSTLRCLRGWGSIPGICGRVCRLRFCSLPENGLIKRRFSPPPGNLGKSTYNNVVNDALSVTSYETARALMMAYMDYSGQNPLGLIPDLLVVGPTLEKDGQENFGFHAGRRGRRCG